MLYHVYASLAEGKQFLADEGIPWGDGSTNDALALEQLVAASRRVDDACRRSAFGSGFGPRLGTNRYDAEAGTALDLRDDLLTTTSVVSRPTTGSTDTSAPAADTDYYAKNQFDTYEPGPYRRIELHGQGTVVRFGSGRRVIEWTGAWGYEDRRRTLTATASAIATTSTTSVTVSAGAEFSPGQTLLIGTEQLYVEAVASTTLTVVRGVNGTTAATHSAAAAIELYRYDARASLATKRLFARWWRSRGTGGDGSDNGGDLGALPIRESEDTMLRRTLGKLRLLGDVVR